MKILMLLGLLYSMVFPQELHLKKGMDAPEFKLIDQDGKAHSLSDYKGTPLVIYFYPKAGTSGCTKQACGIRDSIASFGDISVPVFGISTDSIADIQKFVEEYDLNFPLLSDAGKEVSKSYGVLKPGGASARYTFIIDKEQKIYDIIEVKDVGNHSSDVLKRLKPIL